MKNIALIQARQRNGLTQVQVADRAEIPEVSYQRYELGLSEPKVGVAQVIANVLHTPVEKLFGMYKERIPQ